MPETEEYGVASYVYRARAPFIPARISDALNGDLAGALSSFAPLGTWWAAVPEERWLQHESGRQYLRAHWQEPWGDRRQEIVFIGAGIDWPALKARLDDCLVPADMATGPHDLPGFPDPFPIWRRAEQAA